MSFQPIVSVRAVHLDLKGVPPTFDRLVSLLDVFCAARYNTILMEWEDTFCWRVDKRYRSETAYSEEQILRFLEEVKKRSLHVIPLVQCLGHMETPLSVSGNEVFREVPYMADTINPLVPGARDLVWGMIEDVLELMPNIKYFHLGGDEAVIGVNPDTKRFIEKNGKDKLYFDYVDPMLDKLLIRGIRPILWHDMMNEWNSPMLRSLGEKADLMVWGYTGHPDQVDKESIFHSSRIQKLKDHGINLWGAGSYKSGEGLDIDMPKYSSRELNALGWVEMAGRFGLIGLVATGWSRGTTHMVQKTPIDAALDCLVNVGHIFHDGRAIPDGKAGCLEVLEHINERQRLEDCQRVMEKLSGARDRGWENIRLLREIAAMARHDPRRCAGGFDLRELQWLRGNIETAVSAGEEMRSVFFGLIDSLWIDRYLSERIEPMQRELDQIELEIEQTNPVGYRAYRRILERQLKG